MFNLKRRPRRTGLRAALLAGAAIAAIGAGGVNAGAASAANCQGINIAGSTLQRVAQNEIWAPAHCTAGTWTYEGIGSQEGLNRWGAGGGAFQTGTTVPVSDDAPNVTQIGNIKAKAGGGAQEVFTVPVAQAAIAIIAHPPTGCSVSTISQTLLQEVLSGEVNNWSAFGCASSPLTRVVREDGSGTTYVTKHYLGEIATGTVKCSGGKTWSTLGEESPNTVWPESAKCTGTESIPAGAPTTKNGGGGLATYVNETAGTFGYASLSDVQGKTGITTLSLQNNTGTATFGFPSTTTAANVKAGKAISNCDLSNLAYNLPKTFAGVQLTEWNKAGAGNTDWSHVFGTSPMIRELLEGKGVSSANAQKAYPLCALTYAIGLRHYLTPGFTEAKANAAIELLRYEVEEEQQTTLVNKEKGYGRLFTTPGPLEAAGEAVNNLGL